MAKPGGQRIWDLGLEISMLGTVPASGAVGDGVFFDAHAGGPRAVENSGDPKDSVSLNRSFIDQTQRG